MFSRKALCLAAGLAGCGLLSAAETGAAAPAKATGQAKPAAPVATQAMQPVPPMPAQAPEDPLIVAVTDSSTRFASELYAQLRGRPGNIAFAPLVLTQSLLPVAAGVQGPASTEFGQLLHSTVPLPEAADGFSTLLRRLQRSVGGESNLAVARALWVQQWNAINDAYIDLLRQHCRNELRVIDFARPEYAVHWINRWVSDHTEDRITVIADATSYDIHSCLVVANAIYFRPGWQADFDPSRTESAPFFVPVPAPAASDAAAGSANSVAGGAASDGVSAPSTVDRTAAQTPSVASAPAPTKAPAAPAEVPMMRRIGTYRTVAQPGFRLVQVPYRGEQLSLVVLLPDNATPLSKIEGQLSAARIAECLRAVREAAPQRLELRLPRFKVEHSVPQLTEALQAMGLKTVFDLSGAADFSTFGTNIDGAPIYLSAVTHSLRLTVDEQGNLGLPTTTATAELPADGSTPPAFTVDRPFVFFICDQQTGALLFLGRITDPRAT